MNRGAVANRRRSPASATIVTALRKPIPRKACRARISATWALVSAHWRRAASRRLTRSPAAVTSARYSAKTTRSASWSNSSCLSHFGIGARPHQVPQGLLLLVGDPDRRQIPTTQQAGELERIAAIGLDLIPRSHRDQR